MNASSPTTLPTEVAPNSYIPLLDPATATIEETDAWILALGGEQLSAEELRAVVRRSRRPSVPLTSLRPVSSEEQGVRPAVHCQLNTDDRQPTAVF